MVCHQSQHEIAAKCSGNSEVKGGKGFVSGILRVCNPYLGGRVPDEELECNVRFVREGESRIWSRIVVSGVVLHEASSDMNCGCGSMVGYV